FPSSILNFANDAVTVHLFALTSQCFKSSPLFVSMQDLFTNVLPPVIKPDKHWFPIFTTLLIVLLLFGQKVRDYCNDVIPRFAGQHNCNWSANNYCFDFPLCYGNAEDNCEHCP